MYAIFRKEINTFFSSLIGYIVIAVFLIGNGIYLWFLPGENIFDRMTASLDQLFYVGPFVFWFLIPAITMRSFAEERKSGTIEILSTQPITDMQIVLGKYLAGLVLVLFSLLPTLVYYYTIYTLALPAGNIDSGAIWGSYLGLLFIGATYLSIGIFASSVTDNQIIAFIISLVLCFVFYSFLDLIRSIPFFIAIDTILEALSINTHYISISRGVLDTRDFVYFLSFITAFLFMTKTVIQSRRY